NSYGRVASAALVLYEYTLTLDRESELFWDKNSRGATILFGVNRYLTLILRIANLLGFVRMSDKADYMRYTRCISAVKTALALTLLQYIPWAVFSALRGFALSRSWLLSTMIFVLYITTPSLNVSLYPIGFTGYVDPMFGCTVIDPISLSLSRKYVIGTRHCYVSHLTFDLGVGIQLQKFASFFDTSRYSCHRMPHVLHRRRPAPSRRHLVHNISQRDISQYMQQKHLIFTRSSSPQWYVILSISSRHSIDVHISRLCLLHVGFSCSSLG
ncbi:hypothetical protein C8Q80DRAFT_1291823, partial [Daedaleopsis nitida]